MADDLILVGFVLVFFQEILDAGKCDLIDVFVDLVLGHTQTVVRDLDGLFIGVDGNLNLVIHILRSLVLSDQLQLFQLGNCIAAVADQLAVENIVVGIQPLFDHRKYVLTGNG